jgi:putative peptidoglycan lipid II flippase
MLRSAGLVGILTLLSRITGMLQSRVVAYYLGVGPASDAFTVAYRIPSLLRRFTAEGTMTSAFLPTLSEVETNQGEAAGREMAAKFLGTLGMFLVVLCLLAIPGMVLLTGVQTMGRLAPDAGWGQQFAILWEILRGLRPPPADLALTTTMARIMFPYLLLVSLTAGLSAVLNLKGRFGLTTSVFTFWNLTFIAVTWGCAHFGPASWRIPEGVAMIMAFAVVAGGLVQVAILWPAYRALGYGFRFGLFLRHPGVRSSMRRMAPGLLGTGIAPINATISMALASQLPNGAQMVLFNSNMMGEMILGVFAASIATVSLPAMSRLADAGDKAGLRASLASALRGTAVLALPGAVGMAVLARPIIALIFQTGRFDSRAVAWTASTLAFQAVGILFIATGRITAQCLYALKDFRLPAYAGLAGMVVNIVLSILLMKPLGTGGIALANGLSSIVGLALMTLALRRRLPDLPWREVGGGWASMGLASACMGALAFGGCRILHLETFHGLAGASLRLFPLIALCALAYGSLLGLFRVPEGTLILQMVRRKVMRKK